MLKNILFLSVALGVMHCSSDDDSSSVQPAQVGVQSAISNVNLALDSQSYTHPDGTSYTVSKLSMILTNISLVNSTTGQTLALQAVHCFDQSSNNASFSASHEDSSTEYDTLQFTIGIKSDDFDKVDETTCENMGWPDQLGGGYHYMKFEGYYTPSGGEQQSFLIHTGPTSGGDYTASQSISLGGSYVAADLRITLQSDLNQFFQEPNSISFTDLPSMIMGDASMQSQLQANAANLFTISSVSNGG